MHSFGWSEQKGCAVKKLLRFYLLDLRKGLVSQWKRILICAVLITFLLVLNVGYIDFYISNTPEAADSFRLTFGDLSLSLFAGIDFYYPGSGVPFVLPVEWMFLILLVLYITLDYPLSDLYSVGVNSLIAGSSRSMWWLAKCLWVITSVMVFYCIILLLVLFITLVSSGILSFQIHSEVPQALAFNVGNLKEAPWDVMTFFIVVPVFLCSLASLQLFMSLLIRPVPSFVCMAIVLFLSAYCSTDFLAGEYLMAARSSVFIVDGFSPGIGIVFAVLLGLWSVLFGILFFSQQDILGKEKT